MGSLAAINLDVPGNSSITKEIDHKVEQSITSSSSKQGTCLVFKDVYVTLSKNEILKNVCGYAKVGQTLAILGPSGAGKSTLLNTLTGRIQAKSGTVTLNGQKVDRHLRRKISYVLQQDVFYSNLTLKETLTFATMLRLPDKMPRHLKLERMKEVIDALELNKCLNTRMGGTFVTGLSGGERKRSSIACELLTNPKILILDEPTSGLDSAIAYSLISTLDKYARLSYKTVVTTIHQPSSQIFHMFTNVLLLTNGEVAYFGPGSKILEFFSKLDLHCVPHYNPADFILEQVKLGPDTEKRIIDSALAMRKSDDWPIELRDDERTKQPTIHVDSEYDNGEVKIVQNGTKGKQRKSSDIKLNKIVLINETFTRREDSFSRPEVDVDAYVDPDATWQTGFITQCTTLTKRDITRSKARLLSKLNFGQMLFMAIFAGLVWFQTERSEETAKDRFGLCFFMVVTNGFIPMMDAISAFNEDTGVFHRERLSGQYRLSAFYLAIMTTGIPVTLALPTISVAIIYWMSGLMPAAVNFISFWLIILLSTLAAQSIGLLCAIVITDRAYTVTAAQMLMIASLIAGGFYNTHVTVWFQWMRYLSFITYTNSALSKIEFEYGDPLRCNPPNTTLFPEYCSGNQSTAGIPGVEFLKSEGLNFMPLYGNILVLIGIVIISRIIAYFVLRFLRRPKT